MSDTDALERSVSFWSLDIKVRWTVDDHRYCAAGQLAAHPFKGRPPRAVTAHSFGESPEDAVLQCLNALVTAMEEEMLF